MQTRKAGFDPEKISCQKSVRRSEPGISSHMFLVLIIRSCPLPRTVAPYVGSPSTSSDTTTTILLFHALRKLGGAGGRHEAQESIVLSSVPVLHMTHTQGSGTGGRPESLERCKVAA